MDIDNYFYIVLVFLFLIISISIILWRIEKNSKKIYKNIIEGSVSHEKNLETMNKYILEINSLLTTYKQTIEEKTFELKKYKEGAEIIKTKGMFTSLISILEFVDQFKNKSKNLDEVSQNYVEAIKDKIEILLNNSGVEMFKPELNKNVLEVQGCSPSLTTKKTKDTSKANLIANVVKPGYKLQISKDKFIFLKNAEVEVYELDKQP